MNITIKTPFVKQFGDYHEIDDLRVCLQRLSGQKIKSHELDLDIEDFQPYWAVFYIGVRPETLVIDGLLKNAQV